MRCLVLAGIAGLVAISSSAFAQSPSFRTIPAQTVAVEPSKAVPQAQTRTSPESTSTDERQGAPARGPAAPAMPSRQGGEAAKPAGAAVDADGGKAKAKAGVKPKSKPKKVSPTLVARINLTKQRMTVKVHGKTIGRWRISSGVKGFETPVGSFKPSWKAKMWYSRTYNNAPMPHSIFFKDGAAIHATTANRLLGRPASHGCVRLAPSYAAKFYKLVGKHGFARTRIIVTGKAPTYSAPRVARRTYRPYNTYSRNQSRQLPRYRPRSRSQYGTRTRQSEPLFSGNWNSSGRGRRFVYPGTRYQARRAPYWSR